MTDQETPRGVRNNNPGNLEGETAWEDKIGMDGPYIVFKSPEDGIRALFRDLHSKYSKDGLQTVQAIINKYCPGNAPGNSPKNTAAYIADVTERINKALPAFADLFSNHWFPWQQDIVQVFVEGIIAHENNNFLYPPEVLAEGWSRAFA